MGQPIGKPGCIPLGGNALKEYVTTAGEVLGWVTNLKMPKPSFQLKGHKQLQLETLSAVAEPMGSQERSIPMPRPIHSWGQEEGPDAVCQAPP
eukprot:2671597-Rhodomonas_salina.1